MTGRRVLITNLTLAGRTGTEIVVRDLALGLARTGDRPMVYTPRLGPIAAELCAAGIPVVDDIAAVPATPDVIHGHHVIQTGVALARFPQVPAVFVCHDLTAWHDTPPRLPGVCAWATVSQAFRARVAADTGLPPEAVQLVLNGVDTDRFRPGPDLPSRPRRALAFAKNQGHLDGIRAACARRDIALDVIGAAVGRIVETPETLLPDYDLVFASALTAIEAMACLRPVVVCDGRGLAGMATLESYDDMRCGNFGIATFTEPVTAAAVGREIDRYDPAAARAVGQHLRGDAGLAAWVDRWRVVHAGVQAAPRGPVDDAVWRTALARHLQAWDPEVAPASWSAERAGLIRRLARLDSGLLPVTPGVAVAATDGDHLSLSGFHEPESWGVWSARPACGLRFRPATDVGPGRIRLRLAPFLPPGAPDTVLTVSLDGHLLGTVPFAAADGAEPREIEFAVGTLPAGDDVRLGFRSGPCRSPAELGLSADVRPLGFSLIGLALLAD